MKKLLSQLVTGVVFLFGMSSVFAAIKGETVTYQAGDTSLKGYIVYDTAKSGKRPGVIVVPDWWGVSEFARNRADALAKLGYTAIVMDMYGDGTQVEAAADASKLMNKFTADPVAMKSRFMATRDVLSKHQSVNAKHIAAVGYSLGGLVVLEMARVGVDLDAVVSFWGVVNKPETPARKGNVKAKVLVLNPAEDGWAPVEALDALKAEMQSAGADYRIITYPNTIHAFSRPDADSKAAKDNLPIRYDAKVDKKSWNDLSSFLKTALK